MLYKQLAVCFVLFQEVGNAFLRSVDAQTNLAFGGRFVIRQALRGIVQLLHFQREAVDDHLREYRFLAMFQAGFR